MASPRFSGNTAEIAAATVHLMVTLPMGILIFAFCFWRLPSFIDQETMSLPGFVEAMQLAGISAILELLLEPVSLVSQIRVQISKKVAVEATSIFVRGVCTYLLVNWADLGLIAFGYSYVLSSIAFILAAIWIHVRRAKDEHVRSSSFTVGIMDILVPRRGFFDPNCSMLVRPLIKLTFGFWLQSLIKLLLTEGEKYVVIFFITDDAGVFALVSNLGSLVVRLIFQPIEESGAAEFKKLMGDESLVDSEERRRNRTEASNILFSLLRVVMFLGCLAVTFGPPFSFTVVHVLYGSTWSSTSAPLVLSFYCVYILLMALNGVSEGFVTATLSPRALQSYNFLLIGFAVIYFASIGVFVQLGLTGSLVFVFSHAVNMLVRVLYNFHYISRSFEINLLQTYTRAVPNIKILGWLIFSFVFSWSVKDTIAPPHQELTMKRGVLHLATGGFLGVVALLLAYRDPQLNIRKFRRLN
eukprot:TRINITY_DN32268_c0_g1_i1.p1 TRINITY_DN32268_c0_g1~~TRINITY_DN32268_c0_g1_i1.p1  ORF type:complete len:492 (-),score=109.59 TRINITY_DN32268_c0_g1_i1:36-1442(-)